MIKKGEEKGLKKEMAPLITIEKIGASENKQKERLKEKINSGEKIKDIIKKIFHLEL